MNSPSIYIPQVNRALDRILTNSEEDISNKLSTDEKFYQSIQKLRSKIKELIEYMQINPESIKSVDVYTNKNGNIRRDAHSLKSAVTMLIKALPQTKTDYESVASMLKEKESDIREIFIKTRTILSYLNNSH